MSLLYKVDCDILEIKILYKFGKNLSKNEFARAITSNNSQNSVFPLKKIVHNKFSAKQGT